MENKTYWLKWVLAILLLALGIVTFSAFYNVNIQAGDLKNDVNVHYEKVLIEMKKQTSIMEENLQVNKDIRNLLINE